MWWTLLVACNEDGPAGPKSPSDPLGPAWAGSRVVQRLNRSEIDRALRDLTSMDRTFTGGFPPDEIAFGFDNQAAALSVSIAHVEALEAAVDEVAAELLLDQDEETRIDIVQGEGPGVSYAGDGVAIQNAYLVYAGSVSSSVTLEQDGAFVLGVTMAGRDADGVYPTYEITVDGVSVRTGTVATTSWTEVTMGLTLSTGPHSFTVALTNPSPATGERRALGVDRIALEGPTDPVVGRTAAWRHVVPCGADGSPDIACVDRTLRDFGRRAWRRPLEEEDLRFLWSVVDTAEAEGAGADEALVTAIRAILLSPEFVYRIEQRPGPGEPDRELAPYELASRLAAFAWSSIPDDSLLAAAEDGTILEDDVLREHIARMVQDPRASSLADDLGGQWFDTREVALVQPDPISFPDFDDALRSSMHEELSHLSASFFRGDQDLRWLVDTDEAWIDARLADHYGVPGVSPSGGFVSRSTGRRGITGTAAFLTVHARPARASAVSRGRWVLDSLLCDAPPPPPPDVNQTLELDEVAGSVREQEEAIRSGAVCQTCHASMDAVGFALNDYDAVGRNRATDELGWPIDASVELDGADLAGQAELALWLATDPRLARCAAKQTLTFALGRPLDERDDPVIDAITEEFVAEGEVFPALARAVVMSAPFRKIGALDGGVE